MLILQMPPRSVLFVASVMPTYPAPVKITAELGPLEVFGEADLTGKLSVIPAGHKVEMLPDLRNGGIRFKPGGRLPLLEAKGALFDTTVTLHGSRAVVEHECKSERAFMRLIEVIEHQLPALLAAPLRAPVEILNLSGTVGATPFRVEVKGVTEAPVRTADLASDIQQKLRRLDGLREDSAARVFSAHRYLLQAHRLRYASDYPAQFLGERLLNLNKILEVLFGRSVGELRAQLAALDLRPEVAELLVGLVYVRDESDVGHPAIDPLDAASYETVQRYTLWLEEVMTWLLDHVLQRLATTEFSLKPVSGSKSKRLQTLAGVAQNVARVNPLQPDSFLILKPTPSPPEPEA